MNLSHSINLFVSQWEILMWRPALLLSVAGSRGQLKFQRRSYSPFVRRDAPQHQLSQTEPKAIDPSSFHSFITKVFYCPLSLGPPLSFPPLFLGFSRCQGLWMFLDHSCFTRVHLLLQRLRNLLTLAQWGRRQSGLTHFWHGAVVFKPWPPSHNDHIVA